MKFKLVVIDLELSARAKRIAAAVVASLFVVGGGAIAYADVTHAWKDGEVLNATDLNDNFKQIDQRVGALEQSEAASGTQFQARMEAGSTVSIPQGSNGTVAGGAVNPSTTQMLWQSATSVVGTDAAGLATISYPTSFPHGVLSVVVMDGDANGWPLFMGLAGATTPSSFQAKVWDSNGALQINAATIRFNWIAVGW